MKINMRKHYLLTLTLCAMPMLAVANTATHSDHGAHDHSTHDHSTPEGMAAHNKMMEKASGSQQTTSAHSHETTNGEIRKIDKVRGKITVKHEPLSHLNMPAMTMVFEVTNREWLDEFSVGDKVTFIADRVNGQLTITKLLKRD